MGAHLIDGEFQSDKYPTRLRGKVPLSVRDRTAQDLLWTYAQRRRAVDAEFSDDLETALKAAGFTPEPKAAMSDAVERVAQALLIARDLDPDTLHWHEPGEKDRKTGERWPDDAILCNGKPAHKAWREWVHEARAALAAAPGRDEVIEECARVCLDRLGRVKTISGQRAIYEVADAIRALKSAPPNRETTDG